MRFHRARAKVRKHIPGEMNSTERQYADHLQAQKLVGIVAEYWFERLTLKVAADTRYTVDFLVQMPTGELECHEVKGSKKHKVKDATGAKVPDGKVIPYVEEDARLKIHFAAQVFPFRFLMVWRDTDGNWLRKEIEPA